MERRKHRRVTVLFRTTFCGSPGLLGEGFVENVCVGGCRLQPVVGAQVLPVRAALALRLHSLDGSCILIVRAEVVWAGEDGTYGLRFDDMADEESRRLIGAVQQAEACGNTRRISCDAFAKRFEIPGTFTNR